jgi:hypothetical protein
MGCACVCVCPLFAIEKEQGGGGGGGSNSRGGSHSIRLLEDHPKKALQILTKCRRGENLLCDPSHMTLPKAKETICQLIDSQRGARDLELGEVIESHIDTSAVGTNVRNLCGREFKFTSLARGRVETNLHQIERVRDSRDSRGGDSRGGDSRGGDSRGDSRGDSGGGRESRRSRERRRERRRSSRGKKKISCRITSKDCPMNCFERLIVSEWIECHGIACRGSVNGSLQQRVLHSGRGNQRDDLNDGERVISP